MDNTALIGELDSAIESLTAIRDALQGPKPLSKDMKDLVASFKKGPLRPILRMSQQLKPMGPRTNPLLANAEARRKVSSLTENPLLANAKARAGA